MMHHNDIPSQPWLKVAWTLGLGLGDWVSVKVRFGWRIREVPCLQIQGEIYTHSELLRTSGVRRGVGVNESVKKGHPGSQGELGSKGTVSGRVKAVVGSILVAHDGNRGLRSLKRRHGVGCEERCESGPEADCYLKGRPAADATRSRRRIRFSALIRSSALIRFSGKPVDVADGC